jgi:hypothetical protein
VSPYPEGPQAYSNRHVHLIGPRTSIDATALAWGEEGWVVISVSPLEPTPQGHEVWDVHVAVPTHV